MSTRPFRFGISLLSTGSSSEWHAKVRHAASLGYDIIQVADHLGMPAPFPALVAAANVPGPGLGTLVLNTSFYRPALLARDVAETSSLLGGRLELGLGTGYNPAEFEAAGLPFHSAGRRIDHLEETIAELRRQVNPMPPIMVAGSGKRMLRLAAREADIVGFTVLTPEKEAGQALADRLDVVREAAGSRFEQLELNLFLFAVNVTGNPDLSMAQAVLGLPEEQVRQLPGVLIGSPEDVAETLLAYREQYGLTYFSALEPHMLEFAKVMERLR